MLILGISGSLRAGSWNTALLRAATALAPPTVEFRLFHTLKAIPPFDEDDESRPALAVEDLRREIHRADALLIATPEYNGAVPGHLKNALDWASRPLLRSALHRKPTAVIGASTGPFGAVWAQDELRRSLAVAGAVVLESSFPLADARRRFDASGRLVSADDAVRLQRVITELAERGGLAAEAPAA